MVKINKGGGNQEYWVYGLGTSGRLLVDLCKQYDYPVSGIIVGNGYGIGEEYNDIKIYEIEEVNKMSTGNAILFYTVKQEMGKIISGLGWEGNIVDLSSETYYRQMLDLYYMEYFIKKNIMEQMKSSEKINLGAINEQI